MVPSEAMMKSYESCRIARRTYECWRWGKRCFQYNKECLEVFHARHLGEVNRPIATLHLLNTDDSRHLIEFGNKLESVVYVKVDWGEVQFIILICYFVCYAGYISIPIGNKFQIIRSIQVFHHCSAAKNLVVRLVMLSKDQGLSDIPVAEVIRVKEVHNS